MTSGKEMMDRSVETTQMRGGICIVRETVCQSMTLRVLVGHLAEMAFVELCLVRRNKSGRVELVLHYLILYLEGESSPTEWHHLELPL